MSTNHRVVITGLSALTSCGETADTTWEAILAGRTGIGELSQAGLSMWPTKLGGELKHFQPRASLPDKKLLKVISRQDVLGINAAVQAVDHSRVIAYRDTLSCRVAFDEDTAVYVGSPGNKYFQQYDFLSLMAKTHNNMQSFAENLFNEVHPMWLLRILPNNVLAYTGITYGFKGPNHNITNHAVSGTQAILEAYHAIRIGQTKRAIVVAYDVGIEPQALFYYDKLGVISANHLKPFDATHDGTILAEGAAALVLESEASACARDATCYGEIIGGFSASEASGLFSVAGDGAPLAQLLEKTLQETKTAVCDIDFIVAHGNGNKKSDESESHAIAHVFAPNSLPVTAFKWAMGHTLCASGVLDAVLTTYALNNNCVPGIANFNEKSALCSALNIQQNARALPKKSLTALMINRGFASMNACLVIKNCE